MILNTFLREKKEMSIESRRERGNFCLSCLKKNNNRASLYICWIIISLDFNYYNLTKEQINIEGEGENRREKSVLKFVRINGGKEMLYNEYIAVHCSN